MPDSAFIVYEGFALSVKSPVQWILTHMVLHVASDSGIKTGKVAGPPGWYTLSGQWQWRALFSADMAVSAVKSMW